MEKTIWKWTLTPNCTIEMPVGSQILCVQEQYGRAQLWALVDPFVGGKQKRNFVTYGTGHPITGPVGIYVGTFQLQGGALVFHVFEV